ncbi:MAG: Crp/Fnr family transcriptional regulator [Chloroflexi bacterium]|nr:Crp/Fnr family transcriptional regulator [Chloroflexota bacterium]
MFVRLKMTGKYRYLQLVKNHREAHRTVQRVLCTLGRADKLEASGGVDVLLRSLARFSRRIELKEPLETGWLEPGASPGSKAAFGRGCQPLRATTPMGMSRDFLAAAQGPELSPQRDPGAPRFSAFDRKADILMASQMFADSQQSPLVELAQIATERRLKPGGFLFHEGDTVDYFCVIASGRVKVSFHTLSGRCFTVGFVGRGKILGNVLFFYGNGHPCAAQAMTDTSLLVIQNCDFSSVLSRHWEWGSKVMKTMLDIAGTRMLRARMHIRELLSEEAGDRLARVLLELSSEFGPTIPLGRREIAEMGGTTVETASRFVGCLKRRGIVRSGRGKVIVVDQSQLRLLARV